MALYTVSHSDPEGSVPTYLEGPEVKNWEKYCESLMDEAKEKAICFATKGNKNAYDDLNEWNSTIYQEDLSAALVTILESKGYVITTLPNMDFYWQGKWKDDEAIIIHNLRAEIDRDESFIEDSKERSDVESVEYFKNRISEMKKNLEKLLKNN